MVNRPDGTRDGRAAQRRTAHAASTLRVRGLTATDVTVLDLSQTGVRIATEADLAIGDEISIGLAGVGARRAYVAWRRAGLVGCAFAKPLAPSEVNKAFSSASVVRLGTPAEFVRADGASNQADLQHLYGESLWRLPLDAVLVIALYAVALGWAAYLLVG